MTRSHRRLSKKLIYKLVLRFFYCFNVATRALRPLSMFTGIIETTGVIKKIGNKNGKVYFTVAVKNFLRDIKIGSSIACDGVCLTVIKKTKDDFVVELMPETLKVAKFEQSKTGDLINLEKSLKIGERLDGHFVMGHADGTGVVDKIIQDGEYREIIIKASQKLIKYFALKGSVSVNGASLTISGVEKNKFKVSLITHTLKITNLSSLRVGDMVNLEIDMLARYLEAFYRPLGRV